MALAVRTAARCLACTPTGDGGSASRQWAPELHDRRSAEAEVKEARDRVRRRRSKMRASPSRRVTSPSPRSCGSAEGVRPLRLGLALGILVATGELPAERLDEYEFVGELALMGSLACERCACHVDGCAPRAALYRTKENAARPRSSKAPRLRSGKLLEGVRMFVT